MFERRNNLTKELSKSREMSWDNLLGVWGLGT